MLVRVQLVQKEYTRLSKKGIAHKYVRTSQVALLLCDSCGSQFERPVKNMDPRRLSKDCCHVCPNCNQKKFAQKKGVEQRKFWNTTVDLDIDLGSI